MLPSRKRKITPPAALEISDEDHDAPTQHSTKPKRSNNNTDHKHDANHSSQFQHTPDNTKSIESITSEPPSDRATRFAALKARATASSRSNLAEAKAEASRSAVNPQLLTNLSRKSAIASHNLLKADTEAEGGTGAFERKRAWDYTVEESERWDERMARKKEAKDNNVFQDYSAEAGKIYDRQMRELERAER